MSKITKKEIRSRLKGAQRVMEDVRYTDIHKISATRSEFDLIIDALDKELDPWGK